MKRIILFVIITVITLGAFIYEQRKYVTYGEVITSLIDGETVESILIQSTSRDFELKTKDKELIEKILKESGDMKLKKSNSIPNIDYFVYIYTTNPDNYRYDLALGKDKAHIWDGHYEIIGANKLYQLIENKRLEMKLKTEVK